MSGSDTAQHTVVHIGAFDLASYGDQLYPLIAAAELSQRLEDVELLPFGPLGTVGDGIGDGGATWALGPWSPERARELARKASLVLCGGGEIVQGDGSVYAPFYGIDDRDARSLGIDRWFVEVLGDAERDCPVVWHAPGVPHDLDAGTGARVRTATARRALVAVRDDGSRRRLQAAGAGDVEVVPDTALLLPRVLPPELLDRAREGLRREGAYPAREPGTRVLAVQGNHTMTDLVDQLAPALDRLPDEVRVATVSVSPCHDDHLFSRALRERLSRPTWDVPTQTVEGIAAAISGADCYLGVSLHGAITAVAYGRPAVIFDPFGQAKLAGALELLGLPERRCTDPRAAVAMAGGLADAGGATTPDLAGLRDRIDDWFDRIAALAGDRAHTRPSTPMTWTDTGNAQQVWTRVLSRQVEPVPGAAVPGLRRPDQTPTPTELGTALARTTGARRSRREDDLRAIQESAALRAQNADLRGAVAHLEGVTAFQQAQLDRKAGPRTWRARAAVSAIAGMFSLLRTRQNQET